MLRKLQTHTGLPASHRRRNFLVRPRSLHHVLADDVLFVHAPSGIWASNHEVAAATDNLAGGQGALMEIIQAMGGLNAYQQGSAGYELRQGTLNLGGALFLTSFSLTPSTKTALTRITVTDRL